MHQPDNAIFLARSSLGFTQEEMAKALGYSRNYVHLLETGVKPITAQVRNRLEQISHSPTVHDRPNVYPMAGERQPSPTLCRFPVDCDLAARLDKMEAQMDTLVRLLGASLGHVSAKDSAKKAG